MASFSSLAAVAVTVTQVNLRAGPATQYPVVTLMPPSAQVVTYGCLADMSWCDIGFAGQRGWVASSYIRVVYQGQPTVVTVAAAPIFGLAVVGFDYAYWQRYYPGRSFYGHWTTYAHYAPPVAYRGGAGCGPHGCGRAGTVYTPGGVYHGAAGCNDRGCARGHTTVTPYGVHRGATGCNDRGCAHVGTTVTPEGESRRVIVTH